MENLLILHGWGSCAKNWQKVKEDLERKGCKIFLPDLPGFGNAVKPAEPWTVSDYAEWVSDFCEKNNLSQIVVLGHSFGGSVATKFSIKYPEKVRKLILLDSAGIRKKRLKKEIQKTAAHFLNKFSFLPFYKFFRRIAYRTLFKTSDYSLTEGIMKRTYLNAIGEDISDIFANITVPVLLIWGRKDKITPLRHACFIKEKIPGAKLEIIPDAAHNPHLEAPEILVEKIIQFLEVRPPGI